MEISRLAMLACLGLALSACKEEEAAAPGSTEMPPALVTVARIEPKPVTLTDDLPGRVAAIRTASIRPQVGGIIEARLFEQGAQVDIGAPLYTIAQATYEASVDSARGALTRVEAGLVQAQTKYDRAQDLRRASAISQDAYDTAFAEFARAKADETQAQSALQKAEIELGFATIRSPIAGTVGAALVSEGTLVSAGDSAILAVVQQIDTVYVDLKLPVSRLDAFTNDGKSAEARSVDLLDAQGHVLDQKGSLLFADVTVDAATGNLSLRARVDNPDYALLPGMFLRARVVRANIPDALLVPQEAVSRDAAGAPQLVVVADDNTAARRAVILGDLVGTDYLVLDGLKAGEAVVVQGQDRVLADGTPVEIRTAPASVAAEEVKG